MASSIRSVSKRPASPKSAAATRHHASLEAPNGRDRSDDNHQPGDCAQPSPDQLLVGRGYCMPSADTFQTTAETRPGPIKFVRLGPPGDLFRPDRKDSPLQASAVAEPDSEQADATAYRFKPTSSLLVMSRATHKTFPPQIIHGKS